MIAYLDTAESPAGPVVLAINDAGSLIRLSFREGNYARSIEEVLEDEGYEIEEDVERTGPIREQVDAYTRGELINFDLDVELHGTEWQKRVWRELVNIPFGETRSYGDIARVVCTIRASRAVGRANATNPIPLVLPCHRVVGADGSLTGFGGGLHLKKALLEHERRVIRERDDAPTGTQRVLLPAD